MSCFYHSLHVKEEIFYCKGGEALEQVAQRSCGCPFLESVQGQAGWGYQFRAGSKMEWISSLTSQLKMFCQAVSGIGRVSDAHQAG